MNDQQNNRISFENFGKQLLGRDGQFEISNAWAPINPQRLILVRPNNPAPAWQANQTRRANHQEMLLNHNANRIAVANRTLESSINLAARNPLVPKFQPLGSSGMFYPGHSYPKYNLNNVPITEANAMTTATATFTNSFQSTPVTMDQLKFAGNQFHTIAESSSQTKDKPENLVSSEDKGIQEYCNELLKQIVDSPPEAISTACADQKDSDSIIHGEGSGLGIDLNKTPDPKAHIRRKHRPKVIRESKPTRKPNLQKNDVVENPPKKRKYVRKTATTPQADATTGANISTVPTKKSSKKSLNFDLEKSGNEGQRRIIGHQEIQINKDHEKAFGSTSDNKAAEILRGKNVRHGANSVWLIAQQNELTVGNQQSRNMNNVALRTNEKRNNAFSQGRKHLISFSPVTEKGPDQCDSGCMQQYIQADELGKFHLQSETSRISQNTKELICQNAYQSLSDIPSNSIEEKGSKRKHSSIDSEIDSAKKPKRTKKTLTRKVGGRSSRQIISKDESQKVRRKDKEVSQSQPNEETPDSCTEIPTVDGIACRLSSLQISEREGPGALVPYKGAGTIVPYKDAKKQQPRPKVDLDAETVRVFKMLMGDEGSSSLDGTDKEKEMWWEKERNVFRGRADSFIARMHLVQGDRRFSKWKGSVVDSVIGVFLTQNVSDHLSSSAFLTLAAKFPRKLNISSSNVVGSNTLIKEPEEETLALEGSADSSLTEAIGGYRSFTKSTSESEGPNSGKSIMFHQFFQSVNGGASLFEEHNENGALWSPEKLTLNPCTEALNTFPLLGSEVCLSTTYTAASSVDCRVDSSTHKQISSPSPTQKEKKQKLPKPKKVKPMTNKNPACDWDALRKEVMANGAQIERGAETQDSLDYEAVRHASIEEIAETIKGRGMNKMLAERIKEFLNRLVNDHGSIDLEWLRHVPPDKVKDYLLSIRGLGLKSVECVRLLTLHHLAFPVDTNVGRIAVRLGWVPLQPLPESLQIHLLDVYPLLESVQKYLWPRLCKLDQRTLYELHYQMITFGKVFCTKTKPNCNACPMRAECRHFASAFASARLALPGPEEKGIVPMPVLIAGGGNPSMNMNSLYLPPSGNNFISEASTERGQCEPIIELPKTPEPELSAESEIEDIENYGEVYLDEISPIELNSDEQKLLECMECIEGDDDDMSKALVVLTSDFASLPVQKLKYVSRLRTEHQVYELPDSHCLLEKMDKREPDDPSPYLLAIWAPGETSDSTKPPERRCDSQDSGNLCNDNECFSCNSIREADSQIVRGTILIPCRTATKGSFPLNGTYFQVNELFADHASSIKPINIPREWIWNLPRRTVYFGTSVTSIFRGLSTKQIQQCFWRGFVCVRGFDQQERAPRPLVKRLHNAERKLVQPKTDKRK